MYKLSYITAVVQLLLYKHDMGVVKHEVNFVQIDLTLYA